MIGPALLIGVGAMVALAGVLLAVSNLLGIHTTPNPVGGKARVIRRRTLKPIYVVGALAGLVTLLLTGWVVAGIAATGLVVLVPSILAKTGAQEEIVRLEALGAWTRRLSDLLASGAVSSLDRALLKSASVTPIAISAEVTGLVSRMGPQGTQVALLTFAKEMADPVADEVVMSLVLQQRHGGRGLAAVLADLSTHVDDQIRMRREVEADRAKPRSNVRTIVLLTLGLSAGIALFARAYVAPYGTVEGQFALAGVAGIFTSALLWLRRMIRQTPDERLLVPADLEPEPGP
jgi:tight adherence protein B